MSFLPARSDPPIERAEELREYFERGAKGGEDRLVGIEFECLPVCARTGGAALPDGSASAQAVLEEMAALPGYESVSEEGKLVLIRTGGRTVTLEPGGQLELAGSPHAVLATLAQELDDHLRDLGRASSGPVRMLALGEHPIATLDEIPWVAKQRYQILAAFLAGRGRLSHHMMKKTATVQASFDYSGADDAMAKLRLGLLLTPVLIGLSANSPYAGGRFTGYLSHRMAVWVETDPQRSGRFPQALDPAFDLNAYVEHLLDLPLIFLRRGDQWRDGGGLTFRQFLDRGLDGERATLYDWELHISSFFPDVRIKQVVEIRGADCPPRGLIVPLTAFLKGLVYGSDGAAAVSELLAGLTVEEHRELQHDASVRGLQAGEGGTALTLLAGRLLEVARDGLDDDEVAWLDPLFELVDRGRSPAAELVEQFGEVIDDPKNLVEATRIP